MRSTRDRRVAISAVAAVVSAATCLTLVPGQATATDVGPPRPAEQILTPLVAGFPAQPQPSAPDGTDWRQRAVDYDSFVYDRTPQADRYPTVLDDSTYLVGGAPSPKLPAYYADTRVEVDGYQEAVNQIASVVGASLVGIDKSAQDGVDYVAALQAFVHDDLGVALNNPLDRSDAGADTYWYTTTANVLYAMLDDSYPGRDEVTSTFRSIADRHYEMVVALGGPEADFTGQGFSFRTMTVNPGNRDEGGDGAAGTAAILLWAWDAFGDERYLDGARWSIDYLDRSPHNLFYEILPVLLPTVAARLNAEAGTSYDPSRYVRWLESGSVARPGWGTMSGTWGQTDIHGLQGSQTDGGGYAFAMNSFSLGLLAPTAKYDARYADLVGRWLYAVDHAARFFFPDQTTAEHQSHGDRFRDSAASAIPYEGLRAHEADVAPRATGDPGRYGADWGLDPQTTDLGLYGGSWVGFLGGVVQPSGTAGVLRADLDATDFHARAGYPTSLLYNSTDADLAVDIALDAPSQLFDAVTDTVLTPHATGTTAVVVPARGSVVLVEAPVGGVLERTPTATLVDGVPVAYAATTAPEPDPPVDVALGASVTWSSDQNGNVGSYLTDGSGGTRWESEAADPQWFEIDLGAVHDLESVVLSWEHASAKSYTLDVSPDGTTWTTAHSTDAGPGGVERLRLATVPARFLRFTGTERNTTYGYSAFSLQAYGVPTTPAEGGPPLPTTAPEPPAEEPTADPGTSPAPDGPATAVPSVAPGTPAPDADAPPAEQGGADVGGTAADTAGSRLASTGARAGLVIVGAAALVTLGAAGVASVRRRRVG